MKKLKLVLMLPLLSLGILSCSEKEEGLKTQSHDSNEMMTLMHDMSTQMEAMQATGDADHDFAMMMIMHHQGAIDMATQQIAKGDDATIKSMAQEMKTMQQAEVAELQTFLQGHTSVSTSEGHMWHMEAMESMEKMDNNADLDVITGDIDHDFAILMVNHHQSATEMAQSLLHHGQESMLLDMASKMIEDQSTEIKALQAWLLEKKNY